MHFSQLNMCSIDIHSTVYFKFLVVLFLMTSRKSIYMSKFMDNLTISTLNLNSARKDIHWVEICKVFNGNVHNVNIIIYHEDISKDIFKVFPRRYRSCFNKVLDFAKKNKTNTSKLEFINSVIQQSFVLDLTLLCYCSRNWRYDGKQDIWGPCLYGAKELLHRQHKWTYEFRWDGENDARWGLGKVGRGWNYRMVGAERGPLRKGKELAAMWLQRRGECENAWEECSR